MASIPGDGPAYHPHGPPPYVRPEHPRATTALVLGILGLVVCGIASPFAWQIGKRTVDEIDASRGQLGGRGAAQAGYVLGLVGTVLLGIALAVLVLGGIAVVVLVVTNSTS